MRAAAGSAYETEQAEKARLAEQEKALAEADTLPPMRKLTSDARWPFQSPPTSDATAAPEDFEVII